MTETLYRDWLGQPLNVGSTVLYAVSNGHYAQVVCGEVLAITPVEPSRRPVYDPASAGKPLREREVIAYEDYWAYGRKFKLKIQPLFQSGPGGLDDRGVTSTHIEDPNATFGYRFEYKRELPKPTFIQNVEKVTVFPMSDAMRARLEADLEEMARKRNERWS